MPENTKAQGSELSDQLGAGYAYEKAPHGHRWITDEDGNIDIFAYNPMDPHNGPRCAKCGYGFCHHCEDGPDEDCPVAD